MAVLVWEDLSFVQGRLRKVCLIALENGPRTPSRIAEAGNEHLSHVSRALRELESRGLVECMTIKASKNRIYKITDKGLRALKGLREMG